MAGGVPVLVANLSVPLANLPPDTSVASGLRVCRWQLGSGSGRVARPHRGSPPQEHTGCQALGPLHTEPPGVGHEGLRWENDPEAHPPGHRLA